MATTSAELTITSKYEDGETRKTVLGPLAQSALTEDLKNRIIDRNDATYRATNYAGFDNGFVSNNGAKFVEFTAAQVVITEETILF